MTLGELYRALHEYFGIIPANQSLQLVRELTSAIDSALATGASTISPNGLPDAVSQVMASVSIQPSTLSIPWQAYRAAQAHHFDPWLHVSQLDAILTTVPTEYHGSVPTSWNKLQPSSGSLLSYLSGLIFSTQRSLLIINPYWSVEGVKKLRLFQREKGVPPPQIVIMTSILRDEDNIRGLEAFIEWMEGMGAAVSVLVPKKLSSGGYPLVHAKVMIADGERAYLGSANISENGLQRSIEAGVAIQGAGVKGLEEWFINMQSYFEPSDC